MPLEIVFEAMSEEARSEEKEAVRKQRSYIPKALLVACKKDYLEGKGSIREIAEKYEVSPKALSERCYREGWRDSTEEILQKVVEKVEKQELARLERLRAHEEAMILRMQKRLKTVDLTFSQIGELVEPQDLKSLVGTEAQIDAVIRRNLGAEERLNVSGTVSLDVTGILDKIKEAQKPGMVLDVEAVRGELKDVKLIEG